MDHSTRSSTNIKFTSNNFHNEAVAGDISQDNGSSKTTIHNKPPTEIGGGDTNTAKNSECVIF